MKTAYLMAWRGAAAGMAMLALAASVSAADAAPRVDGPALPQMAAVETAAIPASSSASLEDEVRSAADQVLQQLTGGTASWYGAELAGHRTASGERFDPKDYTAAHRSLPFGSRVRVTFPHTGRSVVVRINDRGPFDRNRVIDVSQAAARDLGLAAAGSGRVELALIAS
jgi:rare lipoprotein A